MTFAPTHLPVINVDMRSQGGLLLEDLMKIE